MKRALHICVIIAFFSCAHAQYLARRDSLISLLKTTKEDTIKVALLLDIGGLSERKGDFETAMVYNTKGLELSKELGYKKGEASAYSNIGQVNSEKGNYDVAVSYHLKALKIYDDLHDKRSVAFCYNNLGSVYFNQRNYKKGEEYYLKVLAISPGELTPMENLALLYSYTKEYDKSLKYHALALKGYEKLKYSGGIADVNTNMALVYYDKGDYQRSLALHLKALETFLTLGDKRRLNISYENIGDVYFKLGQPEKALDYYTKALALASEIGDKDGMRSVYNGLYELYRQKRDFKTAYEYHLKYSDLTDTILNEESARQIAEMDTKYESEKKDKQLLLKDTEIAKQESRSRQQSTIIISAVVGIILASFLGIFIWWGNREKKRANREISEQKSEIELKNKEIIDSIEYAKRIQRALLASDSLLKNNLNEHFVLYKPKDIVSGDFYWAHAFGDKFLLCTADCTGHGVPGAFMSLLNISFLNEITTEKKITQPDKVLNHVRNSIISTLNTEGNEESKDGMDCILCSIDAKQMKLEYAAANNSFYVVRKGELIILTADKMPVGKSPRDNEVFALRSFDLQEGDMMYTFTDGYADQFGGPKGKKFKYKQFEELLLANYHLSINEQQKILNDSIEQWKGSLEQVDDILIIGIRI